jgi:ABC-type transport system involved in multi-copper enzyme maturation permease subunit
MKRLLWKELRERWPWALCWAAVILVAALPGHGQSFCGDFHLTYLGWALLPGLFAVLVGANAYSAEITRTRMFFTFSRPISWQALLTAKLLFAAIIACGIPLLAAVYFRFTCAEPYRAFATVLHLLAGVGLLAGILLVGYLTGLACSVVIPGVAGGILVLVTLLAFLAAGLALNGTDTEDLRQLGQVVALYAGTIIAIIVAGLSLTRFGIVLDVHERIKRFALCYAPVLAACWLLFTLMPLRAVDQLLLRWHPVITHVSPDGDYALVDWGNRSIFSTEMSNSMSNSNRGGMEFGERAEVIRLDDGAITMQLPVNSADPKAPSSAPNYLWEWHWLSGHRAYYTMPERISNNGATAGVIKPSIVILDAATGKQLEVPAPSGWMPPSQSPFGDYLISEIELNALPNHEYNHNNNHATNLYFLNTTTGQVTSTTIANYLGLNFWWMSNTRIGYRAEKRTLCPVSPNESERVKRLNGARMVGNQWMEPHWVLDPTPHFLDVPQKKDAS